MSSSQNIQLELLKPSRPIRPAGAPMVWNPWHGCLKYSEGCQNCYVYRRDESIGKDASITQKTQAFELPLKRTRQGAYKVPPGQTLYTCMTSDFFLEQADAWRPDIWRMIRARPDVHFTILTKRIERFHQCLPADWHAGYPHVTIGCTVENQRRAEVRLPIFLAAPIRHRFIICEPLLEPMNLEPYLTPAIAFVTVGGESGAHARMCDYAWVLELRRQCLAKQVPFHFKQTGAVFRKDGKLYRIPRYLQEAQAAKAHIDTTG